MLLNTRGIVFRTVKFGETSLMLDIYTEARGLRTYVLNGVRKPRSTIGAGLVQVMALVEMVVYDHPERPVNRIKEIRAAYPYQHIPFEVQRGAVGLFMAEVARQTLRESEENPTLFAYLFEVFHFLDSTSTSFSNVHLSFLLTLSHFLGFAPQDDLDSAQADGVVFDLREGSFTAGVVGHTDFTTEAQALHLRSLLYTDLPTCHIVKMPREARSQLIDALLRFYQLHLDNFPEIQSAKILKMVFE